MSFLDQTPPLAFAHRGGAGDWPENTLPAFRHAVSLGYTYLETDVHATADGVLVAFHDDQLDRVTDRTGKINDLTWAEVSQARVDGTEPIPRFDELLEEFPDTKFNVDPKADSSVEPLVELIAKMGVLDRLCLGSFSDGRLRRLRHALGPALTHSLGPLGVARLRAASYGIPVGKIGAQCVQVPHRAAGTTLVDERFVSTAHRMGMQVHVWTIDDPEEMDELLDKGVDGIMTDLPLVLKGVLERRGLWR